MKKIIMGIVAMAIICLWSCEKNKSEAPGNIPGMGETSGDLQVKEDFKLPQGISLIGDIYGLDNKGSKTGESSSADDVKAGYPYFGSGKHVQLKLTVLNTANFHRTVFFPKGLLWQCEIPGFQHGINLQTTWVCLNANSMRTFIMDLYCINMDIPNGGSNEPYRILGVTGSPVFSNLLNHISWRKINYEMIYGTFAGSKSAPAKGPAYDEIVEKLQAIVWNLTDKGIDISAEDIAFLESIPELSASEIPQLDEQSQYPEYFDEFIVPEE